MPTTTYRHMLSDRPLFAAIYVTLISIIQSALLGFLIVEVKDHFATLTPLNWLLIVTTFLAFSAMWNEYRMGATLFFWIPSLRDALIPFSLAVFQSLLIMNVTSPAMWLWFMAGFYLLGAAAYENMYCSARREVGQNEEILSLTGKFRWINPLACVVLAMAYGIMGWAANAFSGSYTINTILSALALLLMVAFLVRGEIYWSRIVKHARAL